MKLINQIITKKDEIIAKKDEELLELKSNVYVSYINLQKLTKRIGTQLDPDNVALKVEIEKSKAVELSLRKQIKNLEISFFIKFIFFN